MSREGFGISRKRAECGWPKFTASIEVMRELPDDWDGEGAKAPSPGVIDTARDLLAFLRAGRLPCPTTTAAGPNGTVLLAWDRGKRYFEIAVVAPGHAEWFRSEPGTPAAGGATMARSIRALAEWDRA